MSHFDISTLEFVKLNSTILLVTYYLGNNPQYKCQKQMKVSLEKYIKDVIICHETENGETRKESVPHSP